MTFDGDPVMKGVVNVTAQGECRPVEKSLKFVDTPSPVAARNQRCPCGSGKKYKRCCIAATKAVGNG